MRVSVTDYLMCALWSTTGDDKNPLDCTYGMEDLAPEARQQAERECAAFAEAAGNLLDDWTPEQAGHDFWLTRNGHGAGFWDRGLPNGEALSDLAYKAGERELYVGDDGLLYFSPET